MIIFEKFVDENFKRHYLRHYCYHDVRRDATMQKDLEWHSKTSQLTRQGDKLS